MSLLRIKEIGDTLHLNVQEDREISRVGVDSRLIGIGDLYVALRGHKVDGHSFLEEAALKGAYAALVERSYEGPDFGLVLLRVESPLEALQKLAQSKLEKRRQTIIGITGSLGKTTIKEFIFHLLQPSYKVDKTPGSYNGQIGVPLTILNARPDSEVLIVEMGMSYKGEMDRLVQIAPVDVAVISRIAPVHIEHFASLEEIAQEKGKILSSSRLKKAFLHEQAWPFFEKSAREFWSLYGKEEELLEMREMEPPFIERHFLENMAAALQVARYFQQEKAVLQKAVKTLTPFTHRFEKHQLKGGALLIDDTYNNNPQALESILKSLPKPSNSGKTVALLGEMRELGDLSHEAHTHIGKVALPLVDVLVCFGPATKPLYEVFEKAGKIVYHTLDHKTALEKLRQHLGSQDVILCKGANSNRLWEVVQLLL
ncbi:MAG: UDP-N-acetylmuramoyl-tripeptide--D-alanyl-D-alanine ligase [Chlamydiae bacterium]|nr:UDP-N-acetylmuramoyl-tripeptide--D-alanyl-D-alanine ligase [Chlamydiota bacterium]